jgi:hypothetical protein
MDILGILLVLGALAFLSRRFAVMAHRLPPAKPEAGQAIYAISPTAAAILVAAAGAFLIVSSIGGGF